MSDVLQAIVASARKSAEERERVTPRASMDRLAAACTPRGAAFRESLNAPGVRVIAECKRRSPSRGVLREAYDPAAIASGYARAGAAGVSVLTEPAFFDGALDHLRAVRAAVTTPILRKDFIVNAYQTAEARAAGADAVLLIVAALDDASLRALLGEAEQHGLMALVEAHTADEVQRAADAGATVIGVNCRDLKTLAVDTATFERVAPIMPAGVTRVAESGIRSVEDIHRLRGLGYHACLIGERFMTAPDPGAALAAFLGNPEGGA